MQSSLFTTDNNCSNFVEPTKYVANRKYTVCAWNIQNAGLERSKKIEQFLIEKNYDFLVLSEITDKVSIQSLISRLALSGYQISPMTPGSGKLYHTLILSRVQFTDLSIETKILRHRTKVIRLDEAESDEKVYIVGAYGYPDNFKNSANRGLYKSTFLRSIVSRLMTTKKKVIILGDLNVVEKKFHEHCMHTAQKDDAFFKSIRDLGLNDMIREKYSCSAQHTWFCPRTGLGQRLDHLFSGNIEGCTISDLQYDHEVRFRKLSDHSALTFCMQF